MELKTSVKVSEVNNLSDARYCAGMGVQMMGFVMKHDTKPVISKENYLAITGWIEGVDYVGEFWNASDDEILAIQNELDFAYLQTDDVDQANRLAEKGFQVILQLGEFPTGELSSISYVIVEGDLDLESLKQASELNEIIFSGDITLENLDIILESEVSGIQLKGGEEIRPGYKNFDELADILEELDENF